VSWLFLSTLIDDFVVLQADTYPPTFVFWVNDPELVHFSYQRYLENLIRDRHPFLGTPLKLIFKGNKGKISRRRTYTPHTHHLLLIKKPTHPMNDG
jgi:hypothetical protein